jgi:amphi-Trp domain-containing protein
MALEKFKYESVQDRETIGKYLQALTDGFKNGSITFAKGDESVEFHPEGMIGLVVKAEPKGSSRKLTIKLGWKESDDMPAEEGLTITPGDSGSKD